MGLDFILEEPKIDAQERSLASISFASIPSKDEIIDVEYADTSEYKEFYISMNEEGEIRTFNSRRNISKKEKYALTNSLKKILVFLDNGSVVNVPSYIFNSIEDSSVKIENLYKEAEGSKILNILSTKNFEENAEIFFFTRKGLIKKTSLLDFKGEYISTGAYKLKSEHDKLVAVEYFFGKEERDILIVTQKAFGIRFRSSDVPAMGRIASGVIGISLKDDDEVVFGYTIQTASNSEIGENGEIAISYKPEDELLLITNKKNKKNIDINQIKTQNRASRGISLMLIVLDEAIKEVKLA
jgi:topoisomerase-4 subunit A